jgi:hypothetical protein
MAQQIKHLLGINRKINLMIEPSTRSMYAKQDHCIGPYLISPQLNHFWIFLSYFENTFMKQLNTGTNKNILWTYNIGTANQASTRYQLKN